MIYENYWQSEDSSDERCSRASDVVPLITASFLQCYRDQNSEHCAQRSDEITGDVGSFLVNQLLQDGET